MELLNSAFGMAWNNVVAGIVGFIPLLVAALIILIAGLIVASLVAMAIERLVRALSLDSLLAKSGLEGYLRSANIRLDSGRFFGRLIYWFLVLLVVLAVADILRLSQVSAFLNEVIAYFPSLITGILILVATILIANFLRAVVRGSAMSAEITGARFLGALTWWVVIIFGVTTALEQLNVALALTQFVYNLSIGLIAFVAIAGGIAFGLGGRDYAQDLIARLRRHAHEE